MKNTKKALLALVLVAVLIIAACGSSDSGGTSGGSSSGGTSSSQTGGSGTSGSSGGTQSGGGSQPAQPATNFPEKPIELIVPFDAGGSMDALGRIMASKISEFLPNNQTLVVVNQPGGGGTVGLTSLVNSKPDGYTLALTPTSPYITETFFGQVQYKHTDFQPIIKLFQTPMYMTVKKEAPWDGFADWFEYAKNNPGKLKVGTIGTSSEGGLAIQDLMLKHNLNINLIPYNGGGPAMTALLGGDIDGAIVTGPSGKSAEDQIKRIFIVAPERSPSMPDVPTMNEHPDVDSGHVHFSGILAPKGVPDDIVKILHDAFRATVDDPEVAQKITEMGVDIVIGDTAEYQRISDETAKSEEALLKQLGLIN